VVRITQGHSSIACGLLLTFHSSYSVSQKKTIPSAFVDISVVRRNFGMEFYTTVK